MNYICNKCGAALDYGEQCECGGRAMRANKRPAWSINPPSGAVIRYDYLIKKVGTHELVGTHTDGHSAIMACGPDEYVEGFAVVGNRCC